MDCIDELCDLGVIQIESSLQRLTNLTDHYEVSDKLLFNSPFVRFWFAFVSPLYQGIKEGNYEEFYKKYENRKAEFTDIIFEQLSHELLKELFKEDEIVQIGRYWDDEIDINILAKTQSGKIIAGTCKYINSKVKKSELTKLKESCDVVDIKADTVVMFSKKGYSNELKSLKNENLKLYTVRNFNLLVK